MKKQIIFKLYSEVTTPRRGVQSIEKQTEVLLVDYGEEKEWKKYILPRFKSLVNKYKIYACYADEDWRVELWKCDILDNCEIFPHSRVLRMDKYLYKKYRDMSNFPIIPCFSENLSYDNQYYLVNNDIEQTPYYAKDGFVKEFETEFEAWEYLWCNNLIN